MISYLNASGSRLSIRPSAVSACGYIKNGSGSPREPGSATSCAKLYAIQFISHDPNSRPRAAVTIASSSGRCVVHDPIVDRARFVHIAPRAACDLVRLLLDDAIGGQEPSGPQKM